MGQLADMVAGKRDYEWDHTSMIASILINANKGKGKAVTPQDIHPTRSSKGNSRGDMSVKLTRDNIGILKNLAGNVPRGE